MKCTNTIPPHKCDVLYCGNTSVTNEASILVQYSGGYEKKITWFRVLGIDDNTSYFYDVLSECDLILASNF